MSRTDAEEILSSLTTYLRDQGLITNWLRSKIRLHRSRLANTNNQKSARSFCFVIIGEFEIHYADALLELPLPFMVGILLHEIAHMVIKEDGGDPELGVDEWIIDNVPEAGYRYADAKYGRRTARNLERVSESFLNIIN